MLKKIILSLAIIASFSTAFADSEATTLVLTSDLKLGKFQEAESGIIFGGLYARVDENQPGQLKDRNDTNKFCAISIKDLEGRAVLPKGTSLKVFSYSEGKGNDHGQFKNVKITFIQKDGDATVSGLIFCSRKSRLGVAMPTLKSINKTMTGILEVK